MPIPLLIPGVDTADLNGTRKGRSGRLGFVVRNGAREIRKTAARAPDEVTNGETD